MEIDPKVRKIIGVFGIFLGAFCFCIFFVGDYNELIIPIADLFIAKYFLVITIINCGLFFIIFGVLNYSGYLVPYFTEGISKFEKAKINIVSIISLQPFLLSFVVTLFILSENIIWKSLSVLIIGYVYYLLISSFKIIIKKS